MSHEVALVPVDTNRRIRLPRYFRNDQGPFLGPYVTLPVAGDVVMLMAEKHWA